MAGNQPARSRMGGAYGTDSGPAVGADPRRLGLLARNSGPLLQTTRRTQVRNPSLRRAAATAVADTIALGAGALTGFAKDAYHLPSDTLEAGGRALGLARALVRPDTPGGKDAWNQVGATAGQGLVDMAGATADPLAAAGRLAVNTEGAIRNLAKGVMPDIRPNDPDVADQFRHNFEIGQRGGDLQFQGALAAAPELRGLQAAKAPTREEQYLRFLRQGFSPKDADYLAQPYPWKGHHVIPRRTKLPADLFGVPLPSSIAGRPLPAPVIESRFNLLRPPGISRGEMYELHRGVDSKFYGTGGLPDSGRWSGKDLGIGLYDPVRRAWFGTPTATKKALAAAAIGGTATGALAYPQASQEGRR